MAQFTALTDSPNRLCCLSFDPTTGIIYAQDDGNDGGGTQWYSYDPGTNSWTILTSCPLNSGNNGGGVYLDGKIYTIYTGNSTQLGVYDIAGDSWTTISNGLGLGTGCIATDGHYIYAVKSTTFKRYDPNTDTWTSLANSSIIFQAWGGLAYYNGWLYGHSGNGGTDFAKYEIATNTWITLADVPGGTVLGSDIDPVGKVYYCSGSYGDNNLYMYDLTAGTWSTEALPFTPIDDGGMVYSCLTGKQGMYITQGQAGVSFAKRATPAGCGCIIADPGGPYTIYQGWPVTLDGSDSLGASSYSWDVNDDGTYEEESGVGPTISWATLNTYGISDIGVYTIGLKIDDGTGCTVVNSTVLNVVAPTPPTVTTQAVSGIGPSTATGHGTITDLGSSNPTAHGMVWNTTGNPTIADDSTDEGPTGTTGAFTSVLTGLSPDTTYYVRAYATNSVGTAYGSEVNVVTPTPPTVTTQAVSGIGPSTATGHGTITDLGSSNPTAHGMVWNTTGNPTIADDSTDEGPTSTTGAFTSVLTGLSPDTTYYVRAYATNSGGTAYGSEETYTTGAAGSAFDLTIQKAGAGTGSVSSSPAGINCGGDCTEIYTNGTQVTLTATPDPGSAFDGFSGGGCSGNGDCTLSMDQDSTITATFNHDGDSDGISDLKEDEGPNAGDGNEDGTLDSLQANVASFQSITGSYVTLISETGTSLINVVAAVNPSSADAPAEYTYPQGFFGFTVTGVTPGAATTVQVILHEKDTTLSTYYKYGSTLDNHANHWYSFLSYGQTGAVITQEVDRTNILLSFVDGQRGDDDLLANGQITDVGAPGVAATSDGGCGCFIDTAVSGFRMAQ